MKKVLKIVLGAAAVLMVIGLIVGPTDEKSSEQKNNSQPSAPVVENPKEGMNVENIKENDIVKSPLKITGYVHEGGWEGKDGQVGTVVVYDDQGRWIDAQFLKATTDWKAKTIRFETTLKFDTDAASGKIEFKNKNPEGTPDKMRIFTLPVRFK